MLLSYTIPCHKRYEDLRVAFPVVAEAARDGDVEIVIVDYGRQDDVTMGLLELIMDEALDLDGLHVRLVQATKDRDYYHMAHARNVGIKAAEGEFVIISSADILPAPGYFTHIRHRLEDTGADWLRPHPLYQGVIVCRRELLLAIGGFDERFEFYGPEDRDLGRRLSLCDGEQNGVYSSGYLDVIQTPNAVKVQNYRLPLSKKEMSNRGRAVYDDNLAAGRIIVNEGVEWGKA